MTASFLIDTGPYIVAAITVLLIFTAGRALKLAFADDLLEDSPGGIAPAVAPDPPGAAPVPQAPGEGAGPSTVHPDWDAAWDRTWTR